MYDLYYVIGIPVDCVAMFSSCQGLIISVIFGAMRYCVRFQSEIPDQEGHGGLRHTRKV